MTRETADDVSIGDIVLCRGVRCRVRGISGAQTDAPRFALIVLDPASVELREELSRLTSFTDVDGPIPQGAS